MFVDGLRFVQHQERFLDGNSSPLCGFGAATINDASIDIGNISPLFKYDEYRKNGVSEMGEFAGGFLSGRGFSVCS